MSEKSLLHLQPAFDWFESQNWQVYPFQKEAWTHYANGESGLVNAPTGSGKTYSLFLAALLSSKKTKGLKLIWVTPIRALAKEIQNACTRACEALEYDWRIEIRTGDTSTTDRKNQWKSPPDMLITTPESIHVMLATKGHASLFENLECVVVDEWHELVGSKRGVQVELGLSRLKSLCTNKLRVWGISATIGNLQEAINVLMGNAYYTDAKLVRAHHKKEVEIITIIPEKVDTLPWAGHLGLNLAHMLLPIIEKYNSTLIFTNTRAQCEIWYQKLLEIDDSLAGIIAMHHGSISKDLRDWVEDALYEGKLKVVVCTSSLELGVDFRPVENIIQIGSPKGVARFMQRAGRSGHQPGATSHIYFLPTHALELVEASALREAVESGVIESRIPYIRSFDVLYQYLVTLAVSDGFDSKQIKKEVQDTFCFASVSDDEWNELLHQLVYGSKSLEAYDEYHKMVIENGLYKVTHKGIALKHRLSIGTIVSDAMINVCYVKGQKLGSIEEWFVSQLMPGEVFWFAGRPLELVRFKDMTAQVKNAKSDKGRIPSYMGGRLPLSSEIAVLLRKKMSDYLEEKVADQEIKALIPLFQKQQERSTLPDENSFLIEYFETKEGWHLTMFPFEGRAVHEGIAALIAKRISAKVPITFSIAMNDYGFELVSDIYMEIEEIITPDLFNTKALFEDIQASMNAVEMAKRKFRDIAVISGMVFQGYPNRLKRDRHLQSSSELLFKVFHEYEPENLLFQQTYEEVMTFQLEESRMREALNRIQKQKMIFSYPTQPTPLSFPLIVDRLNREKLSSEEIEDRIKRMVIA